MTVDSLPSIDVGSPPDTGDMGELYDWWASAQEALRDHFDDGLNVMVGEKAHMAPRFEEKEVEKSHDVPVPTVDGTGVRMETEKWTETEKVPVGEKKVTTGFHIDVKVTTDSEKDAVVALSHSAGLDVRERGSTSRFTHRLEVA